MFLYVQNTFRFLFWSVERICNWKDWLIQSRKLTLTNLFSNGYWARTHYSATIIRFLEGKVHRQRNRNRIASDTNEKGSTNETLFRDQHFQCESSIFLSTKVENMSSHCNKDSVFDLCIGDYFAGVIDDLSVLVKWIECQ